MKKAAHERLEATLAGVKQGAVSLWQRLQAYSFLLDPADGALLQRTKEQTDAEVQRDTVRALGLCETLLSIMLEVSIATKTRRTRAGVGGRNFSNHSTADHKRFFLEVSPLPCVTQCNGFPQEVGGCTLR